MKFISLFIGLAYAHMEMLTPMPRRSKNFRAAYTGDEIDYNMSAPLDEVEYTYPCRGYKPGPVSAEYTAGQDIPITLHGTANHNGGHCQISISYDNVNYIVIKTIYGDCMVNTLSYSAHLPANAPAGKATLAWTWINRSGNREFYMNCADVQIKGQDNVCLKGKKILIANLENTPIFPEMFANDYGKDLFDKQPVVSACGKGSAPSYPTAPTYSTPEVPTPVTPSSKQSEAISTISSSSQINVITSSQVVVPTSSQINIITSSQVTVPTSNQVNVPVTTSSQVVVPTSSQVVVTSSSQLPSSSEIAQPSKKPGHCRPRPTSSISIVPTSSSVPSSSAVPTSAVPPSSAVPTSAVPSSSAVPTSAVPSSSAVPTSAVPSSSVVPTSAVPSSSVVPTSAAPSSTMIPTSAAPSSTIAPSSSSSHKHTKCSHKSTATAPSDSHPASSQMPAPSSSFAYPSSQSVPQSSHMLSSSLAYPTSLQPSYPTANPGSNGCVDNTMKCMGPHAISKCFMKTQYIHACPLGTTCQYLAGYDRCV